MKNGKFRVGPLQKPGGSPMPGAPWWRLVTWCTSTSPWRSVTSLHSRIRSQSRRETWGGSEPVPGEGANQGGEEHQGVAEHQGGPQPRQAHLHHTDLTQPTHGHQHNNNTIYDQNKLRMPHLAHLLHGEVGVELVEDGQEGQVVARGSHSVYQLGYQCNVSIHLLIRSL